MSDEPSDESKLLTLVARRQALTLADGEAVGHGLTQSWFAGLNGDQVQMLCAFDELVGRFRAEALASVGRSLTSGRVH